MYCSFWHTIQGEEQDNEKKSGTNLISCPYDLYDVECSNSCGSRKAAGDAAAAAAAEQAAQTEGSDTSDPYKGGGDNSDPYKGTGGDTSDPYKGTGGDAAASTGAAAAELAANAENYVPEPGAGAKYTVTVTPDNWVKIENEGGATLGLSQKSGVKIIEEDGLAFKDLNQNGSLDEYEDWRKPAEERALNLAEQMKGEEKALMLAHGGWDGDFTTEPLTADDASAVYLKAGGRGGVTRAISNGGGAHAKWTNALQEVAESCFYGIPAMAFLSPLQWIPHLQLRSASRPRNSTAQPALPHCSDRRSISLLLS